MDSAFGSTHPRSLGAMPLSGRREGNSLLLGLGDTMTRYLLLALLAISSTASAVVIRSDVDDAEYQIPASAFQALVAMPGEGRGVLLAPQWVVTAASQDPLQGMAAKVHIGGVAHRGG